ncbi:prolyl oligopeptidase family serine peptidase [Mucilaginibacter sp. AW1-3]
MKKFLFVVLAFAAMTAHAQEAGDTVQAKKPVTVPKGFAKQLDVVYTHASGVDVKMDIYTPPNQGSPTPVMIVIHGGAWAKGSKDGIGGFGPFFKAGFAIANIDYRMVQVAKAPAAIEDTRCALIYLIKNAAALNIDTKKIVIMGSSAGGHLALMGGLLANDHRFDTNCPGVDNIKVAAIIDKYGIADVWDWAYGVLHSRSATNWLDVHSKDKAFTASVSPTTYVTASSPPTLIVHGDADDHVPYQQSVDLYHQLQKAGVKTEMMTVEGGKHGGFTREKNNEINEHIFAFLKSIGI